MRYRCDLVPLQSGGAALSIEGILWAMKLKPEQLVDVPPAAHVTLITLANFTDDYGRNAWPSRETLADSRGLSVKTIGRHLAALEEAGLVVRGDQEYVRHIPRNRRPVVWNLGISGGTPLTPQNGDFGGTSSVPSNPVSGGTPGVLSDPLWGDTIRPSGGTPGVLQPINNPLSKEVTYLSQDGTQQRNIEGPGFPDRDCVHGAAAETFDDRRTKSTQPKCPYCRKAGAITLAPVEGDPANV